MVTNFYPRGTGLGREVEKFGEHRRNLFYILNNTPPGFDAGCAISEYVRAQAGSSLYDSIRQVGVYLCDRFGMKLCNGHCGCNRHK